MGFNGKNFNFPINRVGFTVMSIAKLPAEPMLKKDAFVNAKAFAPDF